MRRFQVLIEVNINQFTIGKIKVENAQQQRRNKNVKRLNVKINGAKMKPPKTRNSYASCVNRIMKEPELRFKNKLERQGLDWREIDKQINELVRKKDERRN